MMTRIRITQRFTQGRFAPTPALWICGEPLLHKAPYGAWQLASVRNAASFFVHFVGVRFSCGGWRIHIFSGPVEAEGGTSVAPPAGWLFRNLMAHPLLGEEDSTSPSRWL
jgi:hypothetical protein